MHKSYCCLSESKLLNFSLPFLVTKQKTLSLVELYMYMTYFVYLLDGIFMIIVIWKSHVWTNFTPF